MMAKQARLALLLLVIVVGSAQVHRFILTSIPYPLFHYAGTIFSDIIIISQHSKAPQAADRPASNAKMICCLETEQILSVRSGRTASSEILPFQFANYVHTDSRTAGANRA